MASFAKTNHNGKSNHQISYHQKGNWDFIAKGTNLSEEEAEKYIDLSYFFSKQAFKAKASGKEASQDSRIVNC